jgi:hypothetical protein
MAVSFDDYFSTSNYTMISGWFMLIGSLVTTAWRVLGLRTEETASRYVK